MTTHAPRSAPRRAPALMLAAALAGPAGALAQSAETGAKAAAPAASSLARPARPALDRSGQLAFGVASYYGSQFHGRTMADGSPMRPESNNAASRTLPLGTTALVTNLRNGRHAVVTIRDRGPYVKGRIIDLSPATARQLGFVEAGLTHVQVTPLILPPQRGDARAVAALSAREAASVPR